MTGKQSTAVFTLALSIILLTQLPSIADEASSARRPFLHPLFTNHMVLQRDAETSIWGWTTPGQQVTVSLAGKSATAAAGADGKWLARLAPLSAGGPYTLTVAGPQTVTIEDVLIGDVWLCSGQSNMQMRVKISANAKAEIENANHPRIRLFAVPWCGFRPGEPNVVYSEPQDIVAAQWNVCSPQTAGDFSAVGYYFARELQKDVDVPIGMISASVGGSAITSWCASSMLQTDPDLKGPLKSLDTLRALVKENKVGQQYFDGIVQDWWRENDLGTRENWSQHNLDTAAWTKFDISGTGGKPPLAESGGLAWCRIEVDLPADWAGKKLKLFLTGIDGDDVEWFNGVKVGAFPSGFINRSSEIPAELAKAGRNVVAIRVKLNSNTSLNGPSTASSIALLDGKSSKPLSLGSQRWFRRSASNSKLTPYPRRYDDDFQIPTVLYNGEIAPLLPCSLKGMLWYQGETPCPGGSKAHRRILSNMIADWRTRFQSPDAWFFIVQLPLLGAPSTKPDDSNGWGTIRADQWYVGHTVTNADTAVTVDLGEAKNIHPLNKQDVGKRLALIARARAYSQSVEFSGPVIRQAKRQGSAVRVSYDHLGGGLVIRGEKLNGFALAGADRHWSWADAKIDGDTVKVSSPQVAEPKFIRYDFVNVPTYCLWNKAGLPAAPLEVEILP